MSKYIPSGNVQTKSDFNSEFSAIATAINTQLDRNTPSGNQMEVDLDMNSNRVLNLVEPLDGAEAATKAYVDAQTLTPVAVAQENTYEYVELMKAEAIQAGLTVKCNRYYSNKDLIQGLFYYIKTPEQAVLDGDVVNGYGNHTLINNNVAILQPLNREVWLDAFGADSSTSNSPELLESFFEFCTDRNVTGRVKFPGYTFDFTGHTPTTSTISRLVGDRDLTGQKCRISIIGISSTDFTLADNAYIDAITFFSDDTDPTTKTLIQRAAPMLQLELGDVAFKWEGLDQTGAVRAKGFIRAQPQNFKFNTFLGIGVESGIIIDSSPAQVCEKVQGGALYVENFGTGLWLNGEPFNEGSISPDGWFKDINIQYISGKNTETQQNNWFNKVADPVPNGKDVLLINGYEKLHVGFVDSERACERALYANTGVGPTSVGGYQLDYSSGIKVVGLVVFDQGVESINRNINIGQGLCKGGTGGDQDSFGRAVTLYDVEHVVVDTINIQGFETGTNRYMSEGVLLQNYCKDVHIKGVKGQITRSAPVVIDQRPNAGKDSYMEDITIEGISMLNPSNSSTRGLIHFFRDPSMADAYSIKNLRLIGNYGKSTTQFGITYNDFDSANYALNSRLLGLIDCDWVDGLTIQGGNRIEGYRFLEGPYRIGPNCNRVKIKEDVEVATTNFLLDAQSDVTWPGPFYNVSNGSEIDFIMVESARDGVLHAKTLPISSTGNTDTPQSLMYDSVIELSFSLNLGSGVSYPFPVINGINMACSGTILETNSDSYLDFKYSKATSPAVTITDSLNFEVIPVGSAVSRFYDDSSGNFVLKNDTLSTKRYTGRLVLSRTTN